MHAHAADRRAFERTRPPRPWRVALAVLLMSVLAGCELAPDPPLRIAAHPWPGYELMFLARAEGWLDAEAVALIETASATASLDALAAGDIEGAALTLDEVLRARAAGIPLVAVLVFNVSAGADALMVRPGIGAIADLRGRRVGVEESAAGALVLHEVLRQARLSTSEVVAVPVTSDAHFSAWDGESLDALVTYEPTATLLESHGARRLVDSRDLPDTVIDVLALRVEVLADRPGAVATLIAGHLRALRHWRGNPQDAAYRMAARLGVPGQQVPDLFRGLELPDLPGNRRLMQPGGRLETAAGRLAEILVEAGLIADTSVAEAIADPSQLPWETR